MNDFLQKFEGKLPPLFLKLYEDFSDKEVMLYKFINPTVEETRRTLQSANFDEDVYFFFRDMDGSKIGFWVLDKNDFSKNPIVYFEHYSGPAVLAPNFDGFLSQLYFGSLDTTQLDMYLGQLSVLKHQIDVHSESDEPRLLEEPRKLTNEDFEYGLEYARKEGGGVATEAWLEAHNIPKVDDLFTVLKSTYHHFPNFKDFIDDKGHLMDFSLKYTVNFDKDKNMFQRKHFETLDPMLRRDDNGFHLEIVNFEGCKIKNLDLSGLNLTNFNFNKGTLKNINFSNCKLDKSTFCDAKIISCNFSGAQITRSDMQGIEVIDSDFTGANLNRGNLRWMTFSNCQLVNVTFTGSLITSSDLTTSTMNGCVYGRCEFSGMSFPEGYNPNRDDPA